MFAGPEIARMVEEFKKHALLGEATDLDHYERLPSSQVTLFFLVNEFVTAMADMEQLLSICS
jgi:hypothetical protein